MVNFLKLIYIIEEIRFKHIRRVFSFPFVNLSVKQVAVLYPHGKNYTSPQIESITGVNHNTVRTIIKRYKDKASSHYLSIAKDFLSGLHRLFEENSD